MKLPGRWRFVYPNLQGVEMRCPGQDRRYWKEDAVFDVPCPECGEAVEFFKDETSGRCGKCGHRFPNPGMDYGCAKWCSLARQCLGFVPERQLTVETREGALAGRLIQEVKEAFSDAPARIARSMRAFHFAREIVPTEGGNPRVVLAAALLFDVSPERAEAILRHIGADDDTVRATCEILAALQGENDLDTLERRVVHDAVVLAQLASEGPGADLASLLARMKTKTGKSRAKDIQRG